MEANCALNKINFQADATLKLKFTISRITRTQNQNLTEMVGYIGDGQYGDISISLAEGQDDVTMVTRQHNVDLVLDGDEHHMFLIGFQGEMLAVI